MKYLQIIASAYGYTIQRGSSDGYSGYNVYKRNRISVGVFFDSLDSVAEFLGDKIREEGALLHKYMHRAGAGEMFRAQFNDGK
mgnify:FL=1|jgi:hypothetical protein|tara:strand:- start:317 stop:565 length:249 start_codon:yes stop_codon:yes gene_type:complete